MCFSILWPSAAVATRIGLESAQPFVIAVTRFFIAGTLMLLVSHVVFKNRLPQKNEWKQLAIYGLLNISIYLGLYVIAMQRMAAGLGSLSIGTNPVFISLLSAIWLKKPIKPVTILSLILCAAGIVIAALPLLEQSYATPESMAILLISMISYSAGAIYFSEKKWNDLKMLTINGWQTLLGGAFLVPFLLFFYDSSKNSYDLKWIGSVLWLVFPVSIAAVQLWLYLLRDNPVKASFWLFLCPIVGFAIAAVVMHEPISLYTFIGVTFVVTGLYLVQKSKTA
ncbi:MAG TPA: DMT family transporter [Panacibacter sp.]|nr:DMT family transporter [Panacibacter sp.]HNP45910.1 DMT family transporter [Panacibacter sp.]